MFFNKKMDLVLHDAIKEPVVAEWFQKEPLNISVSQNDRCSIKVSLD